MTGKCENLLIRCMDYRLNKVIANFIKQNGLFEMDIISVAGSCKDFIKHPYTAESRYLIDQIKLAVEKHGVCRIFLTMHEDCGAYGGREFFSTASSERTRLLDDMNKAEEIIKAKFKGLEIIKLYLVKAGHDWRIEISEQA
jgi:carbonic anhydrase